MNSKSMTSTLIACIAVCLVAIIAMTVVLINGMNKNDTSSVDSSGTSTIDTADTSSQNSTSSQDSSSLISSSDIETSSNVSSKESSSSVTSSKNTSSITSSFTASPGVGSAYYPPNDGDKVAYLTFDDGPSTKVTTKVLETLEKYNVKATFFVVGTSNMNMLDEIYNAGHAIGLHSNTHEWNIYESTDNYFADLNALSDKVYEKVGVRSQIIRFPGGSSNTVSRKRCEGIMTKLVQMVEDEGYAYFDWNVDSNDANTSYMEKVDGKYLPVPKSTIVKSILNNAQGKDKICVLMHDIGAKTTTAEALPEVIEGLRNMGYRFEVLTKDSPVFHQKVQN
ncbi:MAG: polysaccharide deacetylase [Clostridia bacterium]|nr:polysaccharide deacetylase [Clostridia bacterium]